VVLWGQTVVAVYEAVRFARSFSRDFERTAAEHLDPALAVLAAAATAARAMSLCPRDDVRSGPPSAELTSTEVIGTTEVASMLGVTRRHAARLAATLDGRRYRGSWLFDKAAVDAYIAGREVAA